MTGLHAIFMTVALQQEVLEIFGGAFIPQSLHHVLFAYIVTQQAELC